MAFSSEYPGRRKAAVGKRNKYGNRKVKKDGESFDSRKEYRRWMELILCVKAKEISHLRRQVKYVLIPTQRESSNEIYQKGPKKGCFKPGKIIEREVAYIADFVYEDENGRTVVEDCKGVRTKEYIIKRKMMLYEYGIRIKET